MEMFSVVLVSSLAYAFGCSDIIPPENNWIKRHGDGVVTIGCNASRQRWQLACINGKWVGELGSCRNDVMRNKLIITGIALTTLLISVSIVTYGFIRIRALYRRQKAAVERAKNTCICAQRSRIIALNTGNPNVQPQFIARQIPTTYRKPDVTSSITNILSQAQTDDVTINTAVIGERKKKQSAAIYEVVPVNTLPSRQNAFEHGSTSHRLAPTESSYATTYLDLAESWSRQIPVRSQKTNSTVGYILPNELRDMYLDLVGYNSTHQSVCYPFADPKSGVYTLGTNTFKPLLRVHDYLDLANYPTLPRSRSHDPNFKCQYLLPTEFRCSSRRHDYLDLLDCHPNHSSLRRRHSYPTSGYLVENEFSQEFYRNDYIHQVERDFVRPTVYAFLTSASAVPSMPTKNP